MIPLQVILLIMVVVFYTADNPPRPGVAASGWVIVGTVLATHLSLVLISGQVTRRAARRLHRSDADTTRITTRIEKTLGLLRWTTIALAAGQFWFGGWGALVMNSPRDGGWGLGSLRPYLVPHAILLAAPVLAWMCFWAGEYRVESALQARSLPYRLGQGLPTHEPPTLGEFLFMKVRHNFYFFVPMGIATAAEGFAERFRGGYPWLPIVSSIAMLVVVLGSLPWMLMRIWSTVPMTGALRARLEATAARYRLRFSNILIWRTHHAVNNAAIVGYLPFSRYFLMTDALLETLTDQQIEAVFAHEVGHAYHRHIWWYLFAIAGAMLASVGISSFVEPLLVYLPAGLKLRDEDVIGGIQLVLMGAFLIWGFSQISRRFEHQADWFAARHIAATVAPIEPSADASAVPADAPPAASLSAAPSISLVVGAEVFSSALLHLVSLTNRDPRRAGWSHPSPHRRAALLRAIAANPTLAARFNREMWWTRAWIVTLFVSGAATTMVAMALGRI